MLEDVLDASALLPALSQAELGKAAVIVAVEVSKLNETGDTSELTVLDETISYIKRYPSS